MEAVGKYGRSSPASHIHAPFAFHWIARRDSAAILCPTRPSACVKTIYSIRIKFLYLRPSQTLQRGTRKRMSIGRIFISKGWILATSSKSTKNNLLIISTSKIRSLVSNSALRSKRRHSRPKTTCHLDQNSVLFRPKPHVVFVPINLFRKIEKPKRKEISAGTKPECK